LIGTQNVRPWDFPDGDPFAAAFVFSVVGTPGHVTGTHLDLVDVVASLELVQGLQDPPQEEVDLQFIHEG
jgi:hypothetical protein